MADRLIKNTMGFKVMTDAGWSDFVGVVEKGEASTITIKTDAYSITVTPDHNIFTPNGKMMARELEIPCEITTSSGRQTVRSISKNKKTEQVYDLFDVKKGNRYYADNVLVANCEFIIYDETLIDSLKLAIMEGVDPMTKTGHVRWYTKPSVGNTYIITLDPSLGTGGDNAAIQVFEYPSKRQVAEWCHNKTPIHGQIYTLRQILTVITEALGNDTDVYWSVENNSLGEAALVVIEDTGEETFPGEFISEPRRKGNARRYRKGFNTTNKSKLLACSMLKTSIETDRMLVYSKPLLSELKNFVASGAGFAAKIGEKDDLVDAMLLNLRVANTVKRYDDKVHDSMHQGIEDDPDDPSLPMPMSFL